MDASQSKGNPFVLTWSLWPLPTGSRGHIRGRRPRLWVPDISGRGVAVISWYQNKWKRHCLHDSPPASQCLPSFELYPRSAEGLKLVLWDL